MKSRLAAFATLLRSLMVGGAATLVDLAVLAFEVGALHITPRAASLPALLAGAMVQFFGNRHFAFRAASGRITRQAPLFVATETAAMALNAALYHAVAGLAPLGLTGALLARILTTHIVFLGFSYPAWKRVFKPVKPALTGSQATSFALK
jgi:putative flippase GtrA